MKSSNKRDIHTPETTRQSQRSCVDDALIAMQLQHGLDFPTDSERERNVKLYEDKRNADQREIQNQMQNFLLQMPQEILNQIYEHAFDGQILRITTLYNRLSLVRATYPHPFALPSVCRKLHRDTAKFLYSRATFELVTFQFVSLIETWRTPIRSNIATFINPLMSIPTPIKRFEVVGMGDSSKMKLSTVSRREVWQQSRHRPEVDYKAELKRYIRTAFPAADVTFRAVPSGSKV
ncbi:hypothetical protein C7974DRAFT_150281 [Boeremia exigua]|uniref:uncharacterized protein n=1 Tax=Boeremia exigua TaxID=749465 RepID=UPI001E8EBBF3|nr:uncharacterized protein C7974DRAFT_150281 [Boeremia exigua]KAH6637918.1 hypothetical protein C7974DRAFT_150281 [Boeremia exigua]